MKPVAYYRDPFRQGDNILVMCDTYQWKDKTCKDLIPANTNFRKYTEEIWNAHPEEIPWFGIEQEYTFLEKNSKF
jgi:glutamine synthetase